MTQAAVIADTTTDLLGAIGRHVLAHLMPGRRLRVCPRIVKRAPSPSTRPEAPNVDRTRTTTLSIDIPTRQAAVTTPKILNHTAWGLDGPRVR